MKYINNPLWKDLSGHLFSWLWKCSLCHKQAPCWSRPWSACLTCKVAFTSGCCQPHRPHYWSAFWGGFDWSVTRHLTIVRRQQPLSQSTRDNTRHTCPSHGNWVSSIHPRPPLVSQPEFHITHIKQLRRPVLTAVRQNNREARTISCGNTWLILSHTDS